MIRKLQKVWDLFLLFVLVGMLGFGFPWFAGQFREFLQSVGL